MIPYVRPPVPSTFSSDRSIQRAAQAVREKAGLNPEMIATKDFAKEWKRYKDVFSDAQGRGKCAYCEGRVKAVSSGDVEHYRPKAQICEAVDQGIRNDSPRTNRQRKWGHEQKPGYWWLAYDWNNYLFSCSRCNISKANQFPVLGARPLVVEGSHIQEHPLLLHPFDDPNPGHHFRFHADGDITALDDAGRITMLVCSLDRWELVDERKDIADRMSRHIADFVKGKEMNNEELQKSSLRELACACKADAAYAGMVRNFVNRSEVLDGVSYEELLSFLENGLL